MFYIFILDKCKVMSCEYYMRKDYNSNSRSKYIESIKKMKRKHQKDKETDMESYPQWDPLYKMLVIFKGKYFGKDSCERSNKEINKHPCGTVEYRDSPYATRPRECGCCHRPKTHGKWHTRNRKNESRKGKTKGRPGNIYSVSTRHWKKHMALQECKIN